MINSDHHIKETSIFVNIKLAREGDLIIMKKLYCYILSLILMCCITTTTFASQYSAPAIFTSAGQGPGFFELSLTSFYINLGNYIPSTPNLARFTVYSNLEFAVAISASLLEAGTRNLGLTARAEGFLQDNVADIFYNTNVDDSYPTGMKYNTIVFIIDFLSAPGYYIYEMYTEESGEIMNRIVHTIEEEYNRISEIVDWAKDNEVKLLCLFYEAKSYERYESYKRIYDNILDILIPYSDAIIVNNSEGKSDNLINRLLEINEDIEIIEVNHFQNVLASINQLIDPL